jgi:hypothetical protein
MTFHVPAWIRSDPGAPPRLPAPDGSAGQVVALVAADGAVSGGWAAEVALEMARGWSAGGVRLVLTDGGLEAPSLHLSLGGAEGEGLVDALRWGASMRRVARRPEGSSFFVITAGTPVADGPAVLEDPRWPALCAGFREAEVTLAVLVPARDPCLGAVLEQAAAVVVLATPGESIPLALRLGKAPLLALVGREAPQPVEVFEAVPATVPVTPEPEPGATLEILPDPVPAPETPKPEPASGMEALPAGLQDFPLSGGAPSGEEPEPAPAPSGEPLPVELVPVESLRVETLPAELSPRGLFPVEPPPVMVTPHAEPEAADHPEDLPAAFAWTEAEEGSTPEPEEPKPVEPEPEEPIIAEPPPEPELYGEPVPTFEEIVEESGSAAAPARWARRRTLVGLGILVLAVAGAVAAALLGFLRIPGLSPSGETPAGTSEPAPQTAATVAAPPATETSEAAPFSVGLAAFHDEAAARAMVEELSGKVPGVLFTTAPVDMGGQVLHRVLAGAAADSIAALALGARVAEAAGIGAGDWVARWTPRAFQLGEMPDAEAALRRSEVLQGLGVPSYVLAVTYSDGSVRFRVYAGAYADEAEASYLSGLLKERGLSSATLSERTGRLPE